MAKPEVQELEKKISVLKGKQSDHFKKKKADRNVEELTAVREEMNALKKQAVAIYKATKKENQKKSK
ncbi:MAG: hypothetical protein EAZ97_05430 [Bacteroidetes bacterium]|nr:MAG: hypothetical protein EAZ97_05430 [Bacteroidota bacterium]